MKLTDLALANQIKLTKPQANVLVKLDGLGVEVNPLATFAYNPVSGFRADVGAFIAALVNWTFKVHATYDFDTGSMHYNGQKVGIKLYDNVRYLVLALNPSAYSNFLD